MAPIEIERKYLLREDGTDLSTPALKELAPSVNALQAKVLAEGTSIVQGYLSIPTSLLMADLIGLNPDFEPTEARLRRKADDRIFTLKGGEGLARHELEKRVAKEFFEQYWRQTEGRRIAKRRLELPYQGYIAEIDVYTDRDLMVAEVEVLSIEEASSLIALGKDVTTDPRYKNKNLAR